MKLASFLPMIAPMLGDILPQRAMRAAVAIPALVDINSAVAATIEAHAKAARSCMENGRDLTEEEAYRLECAITALRSIVNAKIDALANNAQTLSNGVSAVLKGTPINTSINQP